MRRTEWRMVSCSNDMFGIIMFVDGRPRTGIYNLTLEEAIIRIEMKKGRHE